MRESAPLAPGRAVWVGLGVSLLLGAGLTALPLAGIPGVESALILGLVLPTVSAALGARLGVRARGTARTAGQLLSSAGSMGLGVLLPASLCLWLHAFATRVCDPVEGALFLLLGPGVGAILGATAGVVIGSVVRRPRLATLVAASVPLLSAAWGVWDFYSSPGIFVFDPFVGYFPGTLYDRSVRVTPTYWSYRALSLTLWLSLASALWAAYSPALGRLSWRHVRRHWGRASLCLLAVTAVLAGRVEGPALGHRSSAAHIREVLGQRVEGRRCVAFLPRETRLVEARRLAADCDFRVVRAERTFGVRFVGHRHGKVHAYFYRSAAEKRRLMGADQTFIAKPWRDEVHLQLAGWPHPVLAHEVAHVVAGAVARGPFRVGGSLHGLLPNPGLIEGVAVAIAFRSRDSMTPHQWARAMLELGHMPPLSAVMGGAFFNTSAARSYTVAGSFLRWLAESRGWRVVRRAYRDGSIEDATGEDLATLEGQWHGYLREVPLPEDALALARMRFERPGVVHAICPHAIAELMKRMGADTSAGDDASLERTCREILSIDPSNLSAEVALIGGLARMGELRAARDRLGRLEEELGAPTPFRAAAASAIADALVRSGRLSEAEEIYRGLLSAAQGAGSRRLLEVKLHALRATPEVRERLFDLLLGPDLRGSDPRVVVALAEELSGLDPSGLGPYLAARQLFAVGRYDLARTRLASALARGLPSRRLRVEAERLLAIADYAVGQRDEARRRFRQIAADPARSEAARAEARDWLLRARYEAGLR